MNAYGLGLPARRVSLFLLAALLGFAAGCSRPRPPSATADKRYPLTGEVVSVDAPGGKLIVKHDDVPGLMPGMTMEFPVQGVEDLSWIHPGNRIRADLVVDPAGHPRLENLWPDNSVARETVGQSALALRQDTHDRGNAAYREIGEAMPDFALYDQDGAVVQTARFRGKQIMLNFIYTRCPFLDMCPRATQKMIETQKLARQAGVKGIQFISISLDPVHDTPGVLKAYAKVRNIDTGNFCFLTGPEGAVGDLLTQFGVIAQFDGGVLKHTLATLLIDANGHIIYRADGSDWAPQDFVARMRRG